MLAAMSIAPPEDPEAALAFLWRAVERSPGDATALASLGRALRQAGRPVEALASLRRAASLAPADPSISAALGDLLHLLGQYDEARKHLESAVERLPDDAAARLALARCLFDLEEPEAALTHCQDALALRQGCPEAVALLRRLGGAVGERLRIIAEAAHTRRDWKAAIEAWLVVLAVQPEDRQATGRLIRAYRFAGRIDEADALVEQALARLPDDREYLAEHASNAAARQDWPVAITRWQAVVARGEAPAWAAAGLGEALRHAGRHADATEVYRQALDRFPDEPILLQGLAWCATSARDWQEAARWWRRLLARLPENPNVAARLAAALSEAGDADEGERICREGMARHPEHAGLLETAAWIASARSDWPEAIRRWTLVTERLPAHRHAAAQLERAQRQAANG
jgi:tetratricopeptide (TPR) repeat protein